MKYAKLYEKIGYTFKNEAYLDHAMTRTAYAREHETPMNETMDSLAVLGDAVLDLVMICEIMARLVRPVDWSRRSMQICRKMPSDKPMQMRT